MSTRLMLCPKQLPHRLFVAKEVCKGGLMGLIRVVVEIRVVY
jgi:hypothetical protein